MNSNYTDLIARLRDWWTPRGKRHLDAGFDARKDVLAAADAIEALVRQRDNNAEALAEVISQRDALRKDAARFAWWFSDKPKTTDYINEYLRGVREHWTLEQWRASIDAAMKEEK